MDIPKHASMIEVMQIGQLKEPSAPYNLGLAVDPAVDLKQSMKEDISRRGNSSGNDFLVTQLKYSGDHDPDHKKEIEN